MVLHVVTALGAEHGGPLVRAVLLVMAAGCMPCVRALWRRPTQRVWAMTGVMYAGMLSAHLLVLALRPAAEGMHHRMAGLGWTDLGMWGGVALAAVQLVLVAVALLGNLAAVPAAAPEGRPEDASLVWGNGERSGQAETPIC